MPLSFPFIFWFSFYFLIFLDGFTLYTLLSLVRGAVLNACQLGHSCFAGLLILFYNFFYGLHGMAAVLFKDILGPSAVNVFNKCSHCHKL